MEQIQLPDGVEVYAGGSMETMNDEFSRIFKALGTAIFNDGRVFGADSDQYVHFYASLIGLVMLVGMTKF